MLLDAVANGLSLLTWEQDTFAYAEGYDEDGGEISWDCGLGKRFR